MKDARLEKNHLILAIDPGNEQSAYVLIAPDLAPVEFDKTDNQVVLFRLQQMCRSHFITIEGHPERKYTNPELDVVIEKVAGYGMPVGQEVFDTAMWHGRFLEAAYERNRKVYPIYRKDEKMELCHSMKANDASITQRLVDLFATGQPNHGKGTKRQPGWFYGFKKDIWQAYAVGITHAIINLNVRIE